MKHKWPIGTILSVESLLNGGMDKLFSMDIDTFQLSLWNAYEFDIDIITKIKTALGSIICDTALIGWPPPAVWDFYEGPKTLGLRPEQYRNERMECYFKLLDVAAQLKIPMVATHIGFVPEDPSQDEYKAIVECLIQLANYSGERGITFCLETGQETPITLRRLIEDSGRQHLGINFDAANLLMYGKANPLDSIDMFGEYIKSMHIKDGEYPTNSSELGLEKVVGRGRVDFPKVLQKLSDIGFNGSLIIEREISGAQQKKDIIYAFKLLEKWMLDIK